VPSDHSWSALSAIQSEKVTYFEIFPLKNTNIRKDLDKIKRWENPI
jgi:glutaredoxin-related protein